MCIYYYNFISLVYFSKCNVSHSKLCSYVLFCSNWMSFSINHINKRSKVKETLKILKLLKLDKKLIYIAKSSYILVQIQLYNGTK